MLFDIKNQSCLIQCSAYSSASWQPEASSAHKGWTVKTPHVLQENLPYSYFLEFLMSEGYRCNFKVCFVLFCFVQETQQTHIGEFWCGGGIIKFLKVDSLHEFHS